VPSSYQDFCQFSWFPASRRKPACARRAAPSRLGLVPRVTRLHVLSATDGWQYSNQVPCGIAVVASPVTPTFNMDLYETPWPVKPSVGAAQFGGTCVNP
jgi:hypothetical protein